MRAADAVHRLKRGFQRAWWLPVTSTAVFAAGALVWTSQAEKVYRVEAVLAPASEQPLESSLSRLAGQYSGIATMLGVNLSSTGRTEEIAIAMLRSRQFTAEFIQSENLLPVIFASEWDAEQQAWRHGEPPTLAKGVDNFDREIRGVRQDRRSGLVHLTIEWTDPDAAVGWANRMVRSVNEVMRNRAVLEAERSVAYLGEEAAKTEIAGVRQAAYALIEAQLSRITLAKAREDFAFQIVDPASVPDKDNYARPRAVLVIGLSAALGFALGLLLILLRTNSDGGE